eukprot:CAMPEP_0117679242 /NCGR_PEP_ID=MMETSP0804-20121206/17714_1 /TAXON_ID=1074897 /ORGANISM="Tetraselmis astigmatica, Strain CCMP880" /LENGTH=280 /DNA_ID=CAMNT_0005488659 /DNA_START=251 /DNA_END=1094 /DNA_ORIENTATION=-
MLGGMPSRQRRLPPPPTGALEQSEVNGLRFGDGEVVLNPDAPVRKHSPHPITMEHASLLRVGQRRLQERLHEVDSGFTGHDVPRQELLRHRAPAAPNIMDIQAKEVSQAMRHEELIHFGRHDIVRATPHKVQVPQQVGHEVPRGEGDVLPVCARFDLREGMVLDRQHCVIYISHLGRKPGIGRECPGDVRCVAPVLRPRIHQHHFVRSNCAVVPRVVEHGGVAPGANDGGVAHVPQAVLPGGLQIHRLKLILESAGRRCTHHFQVRLRGDVASSLKAGNL